MNFFSSRNLSSSSLPIFHFKRIQGMFRKPPWRSFYFVIVELRFNEVLMANPFKRFLLEINVFGDKLNSDVFSSALKFEVAIDDDELNADRMNPLKGDQHICERIAKVLTSIPSIVVEIQAPRHVLLIYL